MESASLKNFTIRRKGRHLNELSGIKKNIFKDILKEYCEKSSICGLKHLVDVKHHKVERIIWILILTGALCFSMTLVWMTYHKFNNAPLITTQSPDGISVSKIIFPAVSICTINRISKKKVTELAKDLIKMRHNSEYDEQQMLVLLRGLGQFYEYQPQTHSVSDKLMALHKALGKYEVNELLKNLTPTCEDLLRKCSWDGHSKPCSDLFESRLTMNGYCCAFNYLRDRTDMFDDDFSFSVPDIETGNRTGYDEEHGLKVLIKFTTGDHFYYNLPINGVQLQFTDAYDFPDAPSGSYATQFISPGVEMQVLVTTQYTEASRDIQHIPIRVRKCLFYDESSYLRFYTHSDCMLKCRMLFLMEKCNCIPFNMPKMKNVKTCDLRDLDCLKSYQARSMSSEVEDDGISCPMCYPACSKNTYSFKFINVDIYTDDGRNKIPDSDRPGWLVGANLTSTAIVHVKHGNLLASLYGQNVIMKWFDLFSNIGSTCGFVTGFSFVSVLEFVYYFTIKLVREVRTRQSTPKVLGAGSEGNSPIISRPSGQTSCEEEIVNSATNYRPLYWDEVTGSISTRHIHRKLY